MNAADLIGLAVPLTYFVFLATERLWPARAFPPRCGWQWIGVGFLVLGTMVSVLVPLAVPEEWLARHRLLDGTRLGVVGGALVGFIVFEGVIYAWHRSAHTFPFLWRTFHQIHHSPQRVDIAGSLVFHPTEIVMVTLLQLAVTLIVLGLDPVAAALSGYLFGFAGYFQHWNVRTPQWLGYVLQRPESHCVHHRKGVHYYNFADLPLWDMVFGTFRNPRQYMGECGFEAPGDRRLGAMFAFADVNVALYGPGSRGQAPRPAQGEGVCGTGRIAR